MNSMLIALAIRPFALVLLALLVLRPARLAVERWMPEGRLKRTLLTPLRIPHGRRRRERQRR